MQPPPHPLPPWAALPRGVLDTVAATTDTTVHTTNAATYRHTRNHLWLLHLRAMLPRGVLDTVAATTDTTVHTTNAATCRHTETPICTGRRCLAVSLILWLLLLILLSIRRMLPHTDTPGTTFGSCISGRCCLAVSLILWLLLLILLSIRRMLPHAGTPKPPSALGAAASRCP
jgi:hypothetical protein